MTSSLDLDDRHILDYSFAIETRGSIFDEGRMFRDETANRIFKNFRADKLCAYCKGSLEKVLEMRAPEDPEDPGGDFKSVDIWACVRCGWWCRVRVNFELAGWSHEIRTVGILRSFERSSPTLPLDVLAMELSRRPKVVHDVHSQVFERLVADVVKDFYKAEVTVVGRTGDGGIDLIYVDGDKPTAIQVKRRERPDKVENVALVREFLGALMLKGFTKGKIITTANRFSRGSHKSAERAVEISLVEQFDLIDAGRFYKMFKFAQKKSTSFPWQSEVRYWRRLWSGAEGLEVSAWKPSRPRLTGARASGK
jgi:hypothetical protein